ncbi:MAG: hypothetical protein ACRDK1_03285 [Solirubrobacterales bacterium]
MRSRILWVAAIVLSALSATALGAGASTYRGKIAGDGVMHFRAHVAKGAIVDVTALGWKRLMIDCKEGKFAFRGGFKHRRFAVEGSEFHGSGSGGGAYVSHARVTGSFRKHGARVSGTVRVHGDLDSHHTNCDSGVKRWSAHRR